MTPKEKAEELFYKMSTNSSDEDHHCSHYVAKNCSLIAIDEIFKTVSMCIPYLDESTYSEYWNEVKQEIEKL